ncbi:MAG: DUF3592 domain-containing protein [Streptosporangiales bacterium]|nr:DUF3592 domain-containing protein [Streptosporangiales bacterium]
MSALSGVLTVGGLGVVFAGIGGSRLVRERRLRGSGVEADGVVVGQHTAPSAGGGGLLQYRVIEFTTRDGRTIRVTPDAASTESTLLPGDTVKVYYDPADPSRVSIPAQETGVYRMMLGIGLLLLILLLAYAVLGDRVLNALWGIPAFLGAVFAGIGWFGIRGTWRIKHGGRADGTVVGFLTSESRNGLALYHPVVRYRTADGAILEVPSRAGNMGRPLPPGMPVRVRYDPANPRRMLLAHQGAPAVLWIFGVVGVVLLVIGVAVIVGAAL